MSEYTGSEFEIISKAKQALLDSTNIESSPDEMKVLNDFLFRCWQMGWLDKYDDTKDVVEVRHGHWEVVSDEYGGKAYICECSECEDTVWVYKDADRKWNYCPNCGARMDEEERKPLRMEEGGANDATHILYDTGCVPGDDDDDHTGSALCSEG